MVRPHARACETCMCACKCTRVCACMRVDEGRGSTSWNNVSSQKRRMYPTYIHHPCTCASTDTQTHGYVHVRVLHVRVHTHAHPHTNTHRRGCECTRTHMCACIACTCAHRQTHAHTTHIRATQNATWQTSLDRRIGWLPFVNLQAADLEAGQSKQRIYIRPPTIRGKQYRYHYRHAHIDAHWGRSVAYELYDRRYPLYSGVARA